QRREAAWTDAPVELPGGRARSRRSDVLPVAAVASGRREGPQRDGSARGRRVVAHVEGGRAAGAGAEGPRLGVRKPRALRGRDRARLGIVVGPRAALETIQPAEPGRPARG